MAPVASIAQVNASEIKAERKTYSDATPTPTQWSVRPGDYVYVLSLPNITVSSVLSPNKQLTEADKHHLKSSDMMKYLAQYV